jgi:hypothetical protein
VVLEAIKNPSAPARTGRLRLGCFSDDDLFSEDCDQKSFYCIVSTEWQTGPRAIFWHLEIEAIRRTIPLDISHAFLVTEIINGTNWWNNDQILPPRKG